MAVPFDGVSDADAAVAAAVGSMGTGGLGHGSVGLCDGEGFVVFHLDLLLDEGGDPVVQGVGGVVDGQRAEAGSGGEQHVETRPQLRRVGKVCGEGRKAGVTGARGRGGGDLREPFADSGLAGVESVVAPSLGLSLGR